MDGLDGFWGFVVAVAPVLVLMSFDAVMWAARFFNRRDARQKRKGK